ncbi:MULTISPECIES: glycosyltransferase [Pseudanabaena]|uniref:Glycosyl transferase group 1 n=2 Tax=Pseudanabaena TaxID=1152 RepID=L8N001_9CYAN|nr:MULTISPECIES: glycosyltransferase [Pseudanabaena]ELS32334.1 glycosyl transferase group 1 [Pseudanabaena biceps PCC 7429]MDG3495426.1 glycosyltransferase [Pseudanabaena catenata USMAC16]
MKVLHLVPSIAAVRGGTSIAVIEMVKSLRAIGIDAEIVTTNDNGKTLLDVPLHRLIDYEVEGEKVPVRFFPRFSPPIHAMREFAFSGSLTIWLWQHLRDYDLMHVHAIFSYPATIAMTIARQQNIPYVNSPHGLLCQWSLQQGAQKKHIYLNLLEKANLFGAKAIHVTAMQEQVEIELLGWSLKTIVRPLGLQIPPAIADAREQLHRMLDIPSQVPIMLFLSRIHPKKGLDYLLPALGKLRDRHFAFVLAGSGDPEYEAALEQLLQAHHLGDRTYKLGFVTGIKKNICLQGSDLYVLTSHSENFGVSVLEALAAGTPVLITKGVALAELVRSQQLGWVVDLEIDAIAAAIAQSLDQPQVNQQIGDRAAKYIAEHYTWNKIAVNLQQLYI